MNIAVSSVKQDSDFKNLREFFGEVLNKVEVVDLFDKNNPIYDIVRSFTHIPAYEVMRGILFSRINQLASEERLRFWRENIIQDYIPHRNTFFKLFNVISITDLKRIKDVEIRNLVLLKKIKELESNFDKKEFFNFENYLKIIEHEKFKAKILYDLQKIAKSTYLPKIVQEIGNITEEAGFEYSSIAGFMDQLPNFLSQELRDDVKNILKSEILKNCSFRTITDCWRENFIENMDASVIRKLPNQSDEDLIHVIDNKKCDKETGQIILDILLERESYLDVLNHSKKFGHEIFNIYDNQVRDALTDEEYFQFWKIGKGSLTPFNYISNNLNHKEERYKEVEQWIRERLLKKDEATELLLAIVNNIPEIDTRFKFARVFYAVKYLIKISPLSIQSSDLVENEFLSLILWHFKLTDEFDFSLLKRKFIFFEPQDQVYIFKRLFYLKHKGKIDFDLNCLDEILRADLDLFITNENFANDFVLDISTHILIECMKSFVEKGDFIFESNLILKDLKNNSKRRFKIGKYFDFCEGRMTPKWNWNTKGQISLVTEFRNEQKFTYYKVQFPYNEQIVAELKRLPHNKRKYYADGPHWGVSETCKEELYEIASKHRFFIKMPDGNHYSNNLHLAEFSRYIKDERGLELVNIPDGISFCEGRKANMDHNLHKKEFWWCKNQECFKNSIHSHLNRSVEGTDRDEWENYTLYDFLNILNINIDYHNQFDFIKDGHYSKFLSHINAFNRLLNHLYCDECEHLLYPVNISHFALFGTVRFHCINEDCSKKHEEIYLNKCLYGECQAIIDSRVSKTCDHNLYICSNCGTCCSEEFFKRRLKNLQKVGGYIHPTLIRNVEEKNGHLEKSEYYCYKCTGMMTENDKKNYSCSSCGTSYEFDKFKWISRKWTKKHRRRQDYPKTLKFLNNEE